MLRRTSGNSFVGLKKDSTILKCIYSGDTATVHVVVLPNDTGTILKATITPGGPITFCTGGQVTLTVSLNNHYQWSTGDTTRSITVSAPGIYHVTVSDGLGATASSSIAITVVNCNLQVNIKVFIESYFMGNNTMYPILDPVHLPLLCDSTELQLARPFFPYDVLYSTKSVIDIYGNGTFFFNTLPDYDRYYLVLRGRNTIETWSKDAVMINSYAISFDFTSPESL